MNFLQKHLPWEPTWPINTAFEVLVCDGSNTYEASIFEFNAWRASRFGMHAGRLKKADTLIVSHMVTPGLPDFTCTFYECQHPEEYEFTYARCEIDSAPFQVNIREWDMSPRTLLVNHEECEKELAIPGVHGQTIVEYLNQQILEHEHVWELPSQDMLARTLRAQGFSRAQCYYMTISGAFHFVSMMRKHGDTYVYPVQVRQFEKGLFMYSIEPGNNVSLRRFVAYVLGSKLPKVSELQVGEKMLKWSCSMTSNGARLEDSHFEIFQGEESLYSTKLANDFHDFDGEEMIALSCCLADRKDPIGVIGIAR